MLEVKKDGSVNDVSFVNILDAGSIEIGSQSTEEALAQSIGGEFSFGINGEQYETENV